MKRGPQQVKGYDAAIPAALRRGRVMHFRSSPSYAAGFLISGSGLVVLVCLRLATRLSRATVAEISAEFGDAIAGLCTFPCGAPVSRELWLYSRYGALRFFRVREDGSLEEIDRDGIPFEDGKPACTVLPVPGNAGMPAPAQVPVPSARGGQGNPDAPGHVIRWLKKWNAMQKAGADGAPATGAGSPGKNREAIGPGAAPDTEAPVNGSGPAAGNAPAAPLPERVEAADSSTWNQ